ncbi:MAG: AbrB/MazE/SpoVT family DNA-binding domain-containing protein [Akkermansiaceae bacterium]|jgi:putative addiction module antidote|tara:strand:- start:647 stop:874 length:228 start_codon:yes stop_codon:yes gene_type:complete
MSVTAKITKVGNSSALIIPKEIMDRLNLTQGDSVNISETADGVCVTPYDEKKARQLDLARKIMRENRNMLKKLAE